MSRVIKMLVRRLEALRNRRMSLARQIVSINSEMAELQKVVFSHMDKMEEDKAVIIKMLGTENISNGGTN